MTNERKYAIYKKWFKLGFEQQHQNAHNPNHYINVDIGYRLNSYQCTLKELLPWNKSLTYIGFFDGYSSANPFDCSETIYNINIKKIWNTRLEHKQITRKEYYIHRPHEKVSEELAQRLDKEYGFDGGVYYQDNPWWEEDYK